MASATRRCATAWPRRRWSFDLARGPLARVVLLRIADEEHVLSVTMHHIISDAWSVRILIREIAALYHAMTAGLPAPLKPLSVKYTDYAAWQRSRLQGETLDRELDYWREALRGISPVNLPTDRPRGPGAAQPPRRSFRIAAELKAEIDRLAEQEQATAFMVTLAAFHALLHRYAGQADIATGSPIANRDHASTEGIVGFFVNTIVLRSNLDGDPTFRELVPHGAPHHFGGLRAPGSPLRAARRGIASRARPGPSSAGTDPIQLPQSRGEGLSGRRRIGRLTVGPVQAFEHRGMESGAEQTALFDLAVTLSERRHELPRIAELRRGTVHTGNRRAPAQALPDAADGRQRRSRPPAFTTAAYGRRGASPGTRGVQCD